MPRACSICTHPDREAIDAALTGRDAFRNLAPRFGTSVTALHRHKHAHLLRHGGRAAACTPVPPAAIQAHPGVLQAPRVPQAPRQAPVPTPCAGCETSQTAADIAGLLGVDALPQCTLCRLVGRLWEDIAAQMLLQQCLPETRATFAQVRAQAPAHLSDADLLAKLLSQVVEGCH